MICCLSYWEMGCTINVCSKKCKFPRNVVKFPAISWVFFNPKTQNFPTNGKISWEWHSQIPHFFEPCLDMMIEICTYHLSKKKCVLGWIWYCNDGKVCNHLSRQDSWFENLLVFIETSNLTQAVNLRVWLVLHVYIHMFMLFH